MKNHGNHGVIITPFCNKEDRPHTCLMSDNVRRLSGLSSPIHQSSSINKMM